MGSELGQGANGHGVDVRARLCHRRSPPLVCELVVPVGSSEDGPSELVRIRRILGEPVDEAHRAAHHIVGAQHGDRGSSVMSLCWRVGSEPNHVRSSLRIASQ